MNLDEFFPLKTLPDLLEPVLGKKISRTTLWRWAQGGTGGKRLRTWSVGRTKVTSWTAVEEFLRATGLEAPADPNASRNRVEPGRRGQETLAVLTEAGLLRS